MRITHVNIERKLNNRKIGFAKTLVLMMLCSTLLNILIYDDSKTDEVVIEEMEDASQVVAPSLNVDDLDEGGRHLLTEQWWEGLLDAVPSIGDPDGDGIDSSNDSDPWNRNIGTEQSKCANGCMQSNSIYPYETVDFTGSPTISVSRLGDMDRDGDLDIVMAHGNTITISLNDGGVFQDSTEDTIVVSSNQYASGNIELVDLDLDGDLDIITGGWQSVYVYTMNNTTLDASNQILQCYNSGYLCESSNFHQLDFGDIDSDGYPDILVGAHNRVNNGNSPKLARLFSNPGDGTMQFAEIWNFTSTSTASMGSSFIDYDSDGDSDIALSTRLDSGCSGSSCYPVIIFNVDSTRTEIVNDTYDILLEPSSFYMPDLVESADLNHDGHSELIVSSTAGDFYVYWNLFQSTGVAGIGTPEVGDNYSNIIDVSGNEYYAKEMIEIVDINEDGLLDLLIGSGSGTNDVAIALAKGMDSPGSQIEYEVVWTTNLGATTNLIAGDVDGNGLKDVLLSTKDTTLSFQRFSGITAETSVERSFDALTGSNYGVASGLIADVDGDGDNDLLLGGQQRVSVYTFNDTLSEDPAFTLDQHYGTDFAVGDINRDGYLDLATTGYENEIQFRWGHDSGFNNSADISIIPESGKRSGAIHILDVDGDGYLDIAMDSMRGTQGALKAYVYTYDGNGGFDQYWSSEEWDSTTTGYVRNSIIADLNGDGIMDYLRCTAKQTLLYAGASSGSGSSTRYNFSSTSTEFSTGFTSINDCDIGDLNDDGEIDLIFNSGSMVKIFLGPLTSSPTEITKGGLSIERVDIYDFNGDGVKDLFVSTRGTHKLLVLTYVGGGVKQLWEGGNYRLTRGILHGDLNGDSIPDIVSLNFLNRPDLILGITDLDLDGVPDSNDDFPMNPTQSSDYDSDGFGDFALGYQPDECVYYWGDSTEDRRGCPDQDGDGWSDLNDAFWRDGNQWNDTDSDGYGDNYPASESRESHWPGVVCPHSTLPCSYDPEPLDWDDDGYEDSTLAPQGAITPYDSCPFESGVSYNGTKYGCLDSDLDGWANVEDAFPTESTQHSDTDGDGFGDSSTGWLPDSCPNVFGTSYIDIFGCIDVDSDGVSSFSDIDDNNPSEQDDSDNDTIGDNGDLCPYQWSNLTSGQDRGCPDTDGDGRADRSDKFPYDNTQWLDVDGDGYGDDPNGNNADEFPADASQWKDSDGDGRGDNPSGNNGDLFPNDLTQWSDSDSDGYGNNLSGSNPDQCPNEAGTSQYILHEDGQITSYLGCLDSDNDYIPDRNDDCSNTAGTSYVDRIGCTDNDGDNVSDKNDPYPWEYSSGAMNGDWDNDSIQDFRPIFQLNGVDIFPNDSTQSIDSDGDGFGDNQSGNNPDMCISSPPGAVVNQIGCAESELDDDEDGISNDIDLCGEIEWNGTVDSFGCPDTDEDGYGDLFDAFPEDATQHSDQDGDGYGDSVSGIDYDQCPTISGTSWRDRLGCVDSDGDGYSDQGDECADLPGWSSPPHQGCPDRDSDGVADVVDDFPDDVSESRDSDKDGFGDNNDTCFSIELNLTISCVFDRDNDGFTDQNDTFPLDSTEWIDSDGDGVGDNGDIWPDEREIWSDGDNDGWADQFGHNLTDDCPSIPGNSSKYMMGCSDIDGDGMPDLLDSDIDGDGITNDNEMDASTAEIEYDPFDALSKPPDMDGDGIPDRMDKDTDGDGFPNEMEEDRGSDHQDANQTPFNIYGNQDTGLFYVPGEGFKSQYDPNGVELSVSMVLEMVTSEYLLPILILPMTIFALLAKGRRYKKVKRKLENCDDSDILKEFEKDIDELIMKRKVKVEHGMLLRNLYERRREEFEEEDAPAKSIPALRKGTNKGPSGRSGGPPKDQRRW